MAQKRTLNQRRLTKRQVQELISSGARPRPDLAAALASTSLQQLVYELAGDRYLVVFGDGAPVLAGKGDIYAAETSVVRLHLAYRAPVVIDARKKPSLPDELVVRDDIAKHSGLSEADRKSLVGQVDNLPPIPNRPVR